MHRSPTAWVVRGRIRFETNPTRRPVRTPDDTLVEEIGLAAIDFAPFLGRATSWPMSAEGYVDFGDTVRITFRARTAHGAMEDIILTPGMELSGVMHGDSIAGTWVEQLMSGGARGHFTMRRVSPGTCSGSSTADGRPSPAQGGSRPDVARLLQSLRLVANVAANIG
jgi:hypothetical protein